MKFTNCMLFASLLTAGNAFSPLSNISCMNHHNHGFNHDGSNFHPKLRLYDSVCDIPQNVKASNLMSFPGSAKKLRTSIVTNASGDSLALDSVMGKGTSVVIFLRHMG